MEFSLVFSFIALEIHVTADMFIVGLSENFILGPPDLSDNTGKLFAE
jgi:hypothetical protein